MMNCHRTKLIVGIGLAIGLSACQRGETPAKSSLESTEASPKASVDSTEVHQSGISNSETEPDDGLEQSSEKKSTEIPAFELSNVRPPDQRPRHDDVRLKEAGIEVFESKRLKLYTDVATEIAQTLPPFIDQVYADWEKVLGPLPPDAAGTDFQMTGYLIRNMELFRDASLIPADLSVEHGYQLRNEFWMRDQAFDYYRQHLLIHEATHCYMTSMPAGEAPIWYLEGMAEYFGTHRCVGKGETEFCVIPTSAKDFAGFGRIQTIRRDVAANRSLTISTILNWTSLDFVTINHYSWSWALCAFLDKNPKYRERFRQLHRLTRSENFAAKFAEIFREDTNDLNTEWALVTSQLQYGFDFERAAIDFRIGVPLTKESPERNAQIESDRGWQSSQVRVEKDRQYTIEATGQFTLADHPKPWISEPQGITFRYFDGRPIGMLIGCIRTEEEQVPGTAESMLEVIPIGCRLTFRPTVSGTLYLRVNDAWNSLDDNRGQVRLTVRVEK